MLLRPTVKRSTRIVLPMLIMMFLFVAGFEELAMAEALEPVAETCMAPIILAAGKTAVKKTRKTESSGDKSNSAASGIYLEAGENIDWPCGIPFEDPGYYAVGSDGEDLSDSVEIEGEVCSWKTGTYKLAYRLYEDWEPAYESFRTVNVLPVPLPEMDMREKTIYLTFDDGPCQYTEKVLDILDTYGAKATFFVICNDDDPFFYLTGEILRRGHALGIHCSDHEYSRLYSSEDYFFEDIMEAQQLLYEETGQYAQLYRFPGGSETAYYMLGRRTEGGFDVIRQRLADMGMRFYDWNVKTEGDGVSGESMMHNFRQQVQKNDVPVSLQHDTRLYSVNMLERFISWGVANGYSFASLELSTPEIHTGLPKQ